MPHILTMAMARTPERIPSLPWCLTHGCVFITAPDQAPMANPIATPTLEWKHVRAVNRENHAMIIATPASGC